MKSRAWGAARAGSTTESVAHPALSRLCPNAPECREKWRLLPDEDAALCGLCGQRLERHVLAAMLAGEVI